jgi:hypothetical protein
MRNTITSAALLPYAFISVVALLFYLPDLGRFVVGDEVDFWVPRSEKFLLALAQGDFAGTAIAPHPGVTTMWLGMMGIFLRRAVRVLGLVQEVSFPTLLALMRLPVVLIHVSGIVAGYALLRRLLPGAVALLAALLWATDPFVLGFGRVLHVDGLAGTFATLSLLMACASWHVLNTTDLYMPRFPWLLIAGSGVCAGLAFLSKSPALAVVPIVGLLALREWKMETGKWRIGHATQHLLLWGTTFVLTIVAMWPAVWAAPMEVYNLLRVGVEVEGSSPHMLGNFFMGQQVDAPGALFYPVALALRTTPIALAGLLLLPFAAWPYRSAPTLPTLRTLATLALFVVLLAVALSFFPKKFNRYLVVAFPAVNILAAVGLAWGAEWLASGAQTLKERARTLRRGGNVPNVVLCNLSPIVYGGGLGAVVLAAIINAAWWHPYGIAAFNQALGGPQAGARVFLVGWGEGYEQVADFLNQQPDITGVVTVSKRETTLNPYLRHGAQATDPESGTLPDKAGYLVVYIRHVQGGAPLPPYDRFYGRAPPLHTVTIHGVDYAWIYAVPMPVEQRAEVDFGQQSVIRLHGYTVESAAVQETGRISVTTQWQARAPIANDYAMFLHLFDAAGHQVGQVDVPPGGPAAPTSTWQVYSYVKWTHPLPVSPSLPAGTYWLALGLYEPGNPGRLPLHNAPAPPGAPDDGEHVLFLKPITIE